MKRYITGFFIGLIVAAGICAWKAKPVATVGDVIPELVGATKEASVRTVYIYRDAKKPKGTPATTDVLTAVKTPTGTATALLDPEGYTSIVLTKEPQPWLAKSREWHGSFYAGVQDSTTIYRATIERSFIQTKSLNWGIIAGVDKATGKVDKGKDTKLFVGVGFRF